MSDEIEIGITTIENIIELTSQATDQVVDIGVTDNADNVTINVTPSIIEINVNKAIAPINNLVTSVNTRVGDVVIDKTDVGLGNVDNTGDFDKPISNDAQVAFNSKADLINGVVPVYQLPVTALSIMTGLSQGGFLSINTDNTKFDLSAGFGYIANGHTNPDVPIQTRVSWVAKISNIVPNISTVEQTFVAIDINGNLYLTNNPLTPTERRNYIRLGVIIHLNNSFIEFVDNEPTVNIEVGGQVQDLLEAFGFRSLSGNRIFPVSTNLKIKKEAGTAFKAGANFRNLNTQPHSFILPAQDPITFRYRTQTGAEGSDITDINPAIYDVNGTITPMPATATIATIQRVYVFQDNLIRIQLGQRFFNNLVEAITAINSDVFITDDDIALNGLYLGAIIMIRGTTNLSLLSQAVFVPSSGVSANGSTSAAPLGFTPENVANKQNNLSVDGTAAKYPTVDAVNLALTTKADLVGGLVPQNQLPSYVDDVLEFSNLASFPATGEIGKIYIALDSNKQYRWTGSVYLQITNGLIASTNDVPEGTNNLYFLASRVLDTILTGLSTASTTIITATDTVLSGLGKLQAQININKTKADNSVQKTGETNQNIAGNIGLDVATATEKLDINGNIKATKVLIGNRSIANGLFSINNATTSPFINLIAQNSAPTGRATGGFFFFDNSTTPAFKQGITTGNFIADNNLEFATNGSLKLSISSAGVAAFTSTVSATSFNGGAALTGTPTAPTAAAGTNTTQIATTAFVLANPPSSFTGNQAALIRTTFGNTNNTASSDRDIEILANNKSLIIGIRNSVSYSGIDNRSGYPFFYSDGGNGLVPQIKYFTDGITMSVSSDKKFSVNEKGNMFLKEYTVATLPVPVGTAYATATDLVSPTYRGALTGGGTIKCPVFFNGASWESH
jgi:hypothetical protein